MFVPALPAGTRRRRFSLLCALLDQGPACGHEAWKNGCKKLLFMGSSCIYPRLAPQPMPESCLLTGELEKTNEAYALAKISGLKYCEYLNKQYGTDYISVMPTNLYGPNDNYHPTHSHVLPALIRRFHEAKEAGLPYVTCWGDGSPLREFLYVDDLVLSQLFSLSSFTLIKRLFSSSSLSAIRVVSSAYLRLLIFLPAILIPSCCFF